MPKTLFAALMLTAGVGLVSGSAASATPIAPQPGARLPIVKVANGCGPGAFRTIAGDCKPNLRGPRGRVAPPPCPRGYLRDPDPARPLCYPAY